jgi:hypothetical protein
MWNEEKHTGKIAHRAIVSENSPLLYGAGRSGAHCLSKSVPKSYLDIFVWDLKMIPISNRLILM